MITDTDSSCLTFEEIQEGQKIAEPYEITPGVYEHFLGAFGDRSPIHVDKAYAVRRGFPDIVMPGSILNGFVSNFIGMRFPGRQSLLMSVEMRFRQPCFMDEQLEIQATVAQKVETQRVLVLNLVFFSRTQGKNVATAVVMVKVAHE